MFNIFNKKKTQSFDNTLELIKFDRARDYEIIFARVFNTHDGAQILSYLKRVILETSLSPQANASEIYYQEGRRATILKILSLVEKGRNKSIG